MNYKILTYILVILFLISGCSLTYRTYSGPALSKKEVAILVIPNQLRFQSVDGKETDMIIGVPDRLQLLPGQHQVVVIYFPQITMYGGLYGPHYINKQLFEPIALDFLAEAGHVYIVKEKHDQKSWKAWLEDVTEKGITPWQMIDQGY